MPRLLSIESPFSDVPCMLRLLEPPGSCRQSLWERVLEGTYDKPFIVDRGTRRFLHFNLDAVQSAMSLAYPDELSLTYTRKMMAFLLFNHAPRRILLLGLGGGSLAKFCYRHLPRSTVTAVEVNPHVIALREAFSIPADDDRFRVILGDGAAYVASRARAKDVILMDACDRAGIAPELDAVEFYQHAYHCLARGGVLVTNLCSDVIDYAAHLMRLCQVFGNDILVLQVRPHGNVIALAFKERRAAIDWAHLASTAIGLKRRFGLDFPKYARRLSLDWKVRKQWHKVV